MGAKVLTKTILASAVAQAGTVVLAAYPAGSTQATLLGTTGGVLTVDNNVWKQGAGGFTVVFGASTITITNDSGVTWAAQSELVVSFGRVDINGSYNLTFPRQLQDKVNAI